VLARAAIKEINQNNKEETNNFLKIMLNLNIEFANRPSSIK